MIIFLSSSLHLSKKLQYQYLQKVKSSILKYMDFTTFINRIFPWKDCCLNQDIGLVILEVKYTIADIL